MYKTYKTHLHVLNHSIAIFIKIFRITSNLKFRFLIAHKIIPRGFMEIGWEVFENCSIKEFTQTKFPKYS